MQRRKQRQHIRRYDSGKKTLVNAGVAGRKVESTRQNIKSDLRFTENMDYPGGSGSGIFVRGQRITHNSQLKNGMLVIMDSLQFKSTNVAKVIKANARLGKSIERDLSYFRFVNPKNPSEWRRFDDREFARWDYSFKDELVYQAIRR